MRVATGGHTILMTCRTGARSTGDVDDNRTALWAPSTASFTRSGDVGFTSASYPIAEVRRTSRHFAFVPGAELTPIIRSLYRRGPAASAKWRGQGLSLF